MIKSNIDIPIIVLIGGKGDRFVHKENTPKQLVKIKNKPFLVTLLDYYFKNGFKNFFFPLGHKIIQYKNFFKENKNIKKYNFNIINSKLSNFNLNKKNIFFFNAKKQTNKLQRVIKCLKYIKHATIIGVCYGDTIANINFKKNLALLKKNKNKASLVCFKTQSPFGIVKIKKGYIKKFVEKPIMPDPINIGFYFFKREVFKKKISEKNDLESNLLPELAKKNSLVSYLHKKKHFTINNQKDLIFLRKESKYKKII